LQSRACRVSMNDERRRAKHSLIIFEDENEGFSPQARAATVTG